ncbi:MAG: hypothetical protein PVI57_01270 [Gemmatimonadota bacterium]
MRTTSSLTLALLLACAALHPGGASAQASTSLGAGLAVPLGDFGDFAGTGYTIRGQAGLSLVLADIHVQAGWSHFPGEDATVAGETVSGEGADIFHTGVGARLGLGLLWVGANAAYFFGDGDDGIGIFPEVGLGLGPLEVVGDVRIDGDAKWAAIRGALKF